MSDMANGLSSLATPIAQLRDVPDRTSPVFGFAGHTCGEGIVDQALKLGVDPFTHVVGFYSDADKAQFFAHYVIGYKKGQIAQIADEGKKAMHVGFPAADRAAFLDGSWAGRVSPDTLSTWKAKWQMGGRSFKSPAHLFPGPSTNNVYVGAEMLPLPDDPSKVGATPAYPGAKYTADQHLMLGQLAVDIAARQGFGPLWWTGPRLLGHEDLNPLERSTKSGGWDPGALRAAPWFSWDMVVRVITTGGL